MQRDEWTKDPSVRLMREVFRNMEEAEGELLRELGISRWDGRLRSWRSLALELFQARWTGGAGSDPFGEAGRLYTRCLGRVLAGSGVSVPAEPRP